MATADDVIRACLKDEGQLLLARYLLAGRCLVESENISARQQRQVMDRLCTYLRPPGAADTQRAVELLERVGGEETYNWLIESFPDLLTAEERQALSEQPGEVEVELLYKGLQQALLRLMQQAEDISARYNAGCALSGMGDPRDLDEMVVIPAGEFVMGGDRTDSERPVHRVHLDTYAISKYPVTNAQYQRFVAATGHDPPHYWQDERPAPWMVNHPVTGVSWYDAQAYCQWLSETTGRSYRLPSEAEWEKAARGEDRREWPWGDKFDPRRANTAEGRGDWGTTPVGMYPDGASPYGVLDMAGNVWEWCSTLFQDYPYQGDDGRENLEADGARVLRGGSWGDYRYGARCASRFRVYPHGSSLDVGFRLVSPVVLDSDS